MKWLRNGVAYFLTLILLSALVVAAVSTATVLYLSKPAQLESWLSQSGIYSSVVDTAAKEAQQQADNGADVSTSAGVSLTDIAVQQAAKKAFPPELIQRYVNTFLDANYAWLEGKVAKPSFSIDLTAAKQSFAQQVGEYVTAHLKTLPACPSSSQIEINKADPLTVSCLPAGVSPTTVGQDVTQKLATSDAILGNNSSLGDHSVYTADTFTSGSGANKQAYYVRFSKAPVVYQAATRAPWVLAITMVLLIIGILFISTSRRRGVRRLAIAFLSAGLVLLATRLMTHEGIKILEAQAPNPVVGEVQHSLTTFLGAIEVHVMTVNMWFAAAYLAIAALLFGGLFIFWIRRRQRGADAKPTSAATSNEPATQESVASSLPSQPVATQQTSTAPLLPNQSHTSATRPEPAPTMRAPKKAKRPRLIQ